MKRLEITDPNPPKNAVHPEKIRLLVANRVGETWGELEPLRGTSWEHGVEEISEEAFSHALHGHFNPLLKELGRSPHASGKRVTDAEGLCSLREGCLTYNRGLCRPGGKKGKTLGPVECYEPPASAGTPVKVLLMLREVALAWRDNRHVIVVGEGFNLL